MQDYRDEIKDFFALDKQLASELEYDMKKYNEQLAQEQELARLADVSGAAYRAGRCTESRCGVAHLHSLPSATSFPSASRNPHTS